MCVKWRVTTSRSLDIVLKRSFIQAKKVKLAPTGRYNTKEGLIHFKRRVERDDDDGGPVAQRQRLHGGFADQFG